MAKKIITSELESGQVDNFNFNDPFAEPVDPGTDRDPVTSLSTGFMEGAEATLTSPSFYRQLVNVALPSGYKDTIDLVDNTSSKVGRLYNEVSQDLAPSIREFKTAVKNAKSRVEDYLPDWLNKVVDKMTAVEPTTKYEQYDADSAAIRDALAGVFEQQQYFETERQASDTVTREAQTKQFNTTFRQMEDVRQSVSQLAAYNDKINIRYQQKNIELMYRQLFTARDAYKLMKASTLETISELRAIRKNTGLPEINKLQLNEQASEMMREKLVGKAQDYLSESLGVEDFFDKILANVGDKVKDFTGALGEGLSAGAGFIESSNDMASMDLEENPDNYRKGAKTAGSFAFKQLGDWIGRKIRPRTEAMGPIGKVGSRLSRYRGTADSYIKDWATSDSDLSTIGGMIQDIAKSFIPVEPTAYAVGNNSIEQSMKPSVWNNRDSRSITEIIPGLLARILQSSEKHRLGTENVPLMGWDYKAQKFATVKDIAKSVFDSVGNKNDLSSVEYRANDLIDSIDPDQKIPADLRKKLSVELLRRSTTQNKFKPADLADTSTYGSEFSMDERDLLADLLNENFQLDYAGNVADTDDAQARYTRAALAFRNLRGSLPRVGQTANMFANTGNLDALRQMNLVKTRRGKDYLNDNVFLNKFQDHVYGTTDYRDSLAAQYDDGSSDTVYNSPNGAPQVDNPQRYQEIIRNAVEQQQRATAASSMAGLSEEDLVLHVDRIVDAVDKASSRSASEEALVVLNSILGSLGDIGALLESGIGTGNSNSGEPTERDGFLFTGRAKRWAKNTVGFGIDRIRGALSFSNRARKLLTGGIFKAVGTGSDFIKGAVDHFRLKVIKDVYVLGQLRITAKGIRNGQYIDINTKKTIKDLRGITGPVHDVIADEAVLTQEEFDQGLKGLDGKPLAGTIGSFVGGLTASGLSKVASLAGSSFMLPINVGRKAWQLAKETVLRPKDVYVPGEKTPRLLGLALSKGQYFSSATGKPIFKLSQVDSDVLDNTGAVRLTLEELRQGVVDRRGNPIKSVFQRVRGLIEGGAEAAKHAVGLGLGIARSSFKVAGKIMGGAVNLARGLAPNVYFGKGGPGGGDGPETVSILKDIYNLLVDHFGSPQHFDPSLGGSGGPEQPMGPSGPGGKSGWKNWFRKPNLTMPNLPKFTNPLSGFTVPNMPGMPTMPNFNMPTLPDMPGFGVLQSAANKVDTAGLKTQADNWWQLAKDKTSSIDTNGLKSSAKDLLAQSKSKGKDIYNTASSAVDNLDTKQLLTAVMSGLDKVAKQVNPDNADDNADGRIDYQEKIEARDEEFRAGSVADILAKRKAAKDAKTSESKSDNKPEEKRSGWLGKLMPVIMGIGTYIKGMFTRIGDMVSGFGTLRKILQTIAIGKSAADIGGIGGVDLPDGDGKEVSKGKGGRLRNLGGKIMKYGGRALGVAGAAYGAVSAVNNISEGNYGAAAVDAGIAAGGVALTTGGLAGVGSLLTGTGAAIAAAVSSPVLLTAAGVGLAAYGVYKLYKAFSDVPLLVRVRMAQYGIPLDATSEISKVQALESAALKEVSIKSGTSANISGKIDYVKWVEEFGLDPTNKNHVQMWASWYQNRFKPVFLHNVALLSSMAPGVSIEDVDSDLDESLRASFAKASKVKDSNVFTYLASPFPDVQLVPGENAINSAINDVIAKYKDVAAKEYNTAGVSKTVNGKEVLTTQVGNKTNSTVSGSLLNSTTNFASKTNTTGTPLANPTSNLDSNMMIGRGSILDNLTALRMKIYGLDKLDVGRVQALLKLETEVVKDITMRGDAAQYNGNSVDLYNQMASVFGGSASDVEHRQLWMFWFNYRFLPTYLNYYAAVKRQDRSVDPTQASNVFNKNAQYNVAMAINSSMANVSGKSVSVWTIDASPFIGVSLNTDSGAAKAYMQLMENESNRETYNEPTGVAKLNSALKDSKGGMNKLGFTRPAVFTDTQPITKTRKPFSQAGNAADRFISSNPTLISSEAGSGAYKDIPAATGSGWDAVKNTILSAAKIVGVDPAVMAMLAKLESSFRPDAKASTSSASGLFQFIASTWKGLKEKFGAKYGIPENAKATDPRAAALLAGEYIKQNQTYLEGRLNRGVNATDIYAAHFMGPAGGAKLLSADPTDTGANVFPAAAKANTSIFYTKDSRPRTIAEIYQVLDNKVTGGSVPTDQLASTPSAAISKSATDLIDQPPVASNVVDLGTEKSKRSNAVAPFKTTGVVNKPALPAVETKPTATTTVSKPASFADVYVPTNNTSMQDKQRAVQQSTNSLELNKHIKDSATIQDQQLQVQIKMSNTLEMIYALMEQKDNAPKVTPANNSGMQTANRPMSAAIPLKSNIG
jgi:hypothetical protein